MSRKADLPESNTEAPRGQSALTLPLQLGRADLLGEPTTAESNEGGAASGENPGLRVLARMIARDVVDKNLTGAEDAGSVSRNGKDG